MDGFTPRKGALWLSSPKSSAVPEPSLAGSRETNENDQAPDHKRITKHFMSPTISAASKATVPRRKILSERNEISSSCDSHPNKASNFGSKTNSQHSNSHQSGKSSAIPISSHNYASESEDDQQNNSVVDSSSKAYDPLTNYLSPRPKFLRYQPHRRREILDSQKSNDKPESLQLTKDSSSPPEQLNSKPQNEDIVEDDEDSVEDDDEEVEFVDREWGLKGLIKLVLLLVVFFLSSSNLSSTNYMVTSETHNMIQKNIFEAVSLETYGCGTLYVDQPEDSVSGLMELSQDETNYDLKAVKLAEDPEGLVKVETGEMEKMVDQQEGGPSADIDSEEENTEVSVTHSLLHGGEEETMSKALSEVISSNEVEQEEVEGSEHLHKDLPNIEALLDNFLSDSANAQCAQSSSKFGQAVETEFKVEQLEGISQESAGEELLLKEVEETEWRLDDNSDREIEINNLDIEIESKDGKVKEIGLNKALVTGISVACLVLALLSVMCFSRKARDSIQSPQAGISNPLLASVEGEHSKRKTETTPNVSSLFDPMDGPQKKARYSLDRFQFQPERISAIGSISEASPLFGAKKEASKEISHASAPNVELLGELVVGEVSSSLRSCVRRNRMVEAEESTTYSSQPTASQQLSAQPSVLDHSTADSLSFGSFTAEKKILKKKVEKDGGEVKTEVMSTPVRRSSRIRDRSVMSP